MRQFIGEIQIDNNVMAADPCQDPYNIFVIVEAEAKKGTWNAYVTVENKKKTIKSVEILHENAGNCDERQWEHLGDIEVDSGQAGFFDSEYLKVNQPDNQWDRKDGKSWYRKVSDMTINVRYGCVDNRCVVSDSNGDGCYEVLYMEDETHNTIGLKLIFKF